jgi:transcriptional regulator with XRE-family HTH domain
MTTDEVLQALHRYTRESPGTDRQTAMELGVTEALLLDWLQGVVRPERCMLARLAGFLRRVGYI